MTMIIRWQTRKVTLESLDKTARLSEAILMGKRKDFRPLRGLDSRCLRERLQRAAEEQIGKKCPSFGRKISTPS